MKVVGCHYDARTPSSGPSTYRRRQAGNAALSIEAKHVISSAPMKQLVNGMTPRMPEHVIKAANSLKYRDFLTVVLILKDRQAFDDNWIYIHDPSVKVGRMQNFKIVVAGNGRPIRRMTCYGLEYFCFEGDGLWNCVRRRPDRAGQARAGTRSAWPSREDVVDGCVVRQPKAYPVYDDDYAKHVNTIREELDKNYPNLHLVGRNGMHKYNNQDHAMMTAMLCAKNIVAGEQVFDLWQVNQDAEYHEAGKAGEQSRGRRDGVAAGADEGQGGGEGGGVVIQWSCKKLGTGRDANDQANRYWRGLVCRVLLCRVLCRGRNRRGRGCEQAWEKREREYRRGRGRCAGEEFGKKYGIYILFLSATFAGIGAVAGILPGTRSIAAPAPPADGEAEPMPGGEVDGPVGLTQTGKLHRRSIDPADDMRSCGINLETAGNRLRSYSSCGSR